MDKLTPLERQRLKKMIGRVVTHFKGKDYLVIDVAEHTETGEDLVIYKALYEALLDAPGFAPNCPCAGRKSNENS